jgi:hypothetical protein
MLVGESHQLREGHVIDLLGLDDLHEKVETDGAVLHPDAVEAPRSLVRRGHLALLQVPKVLSMSVLG